MKNFKTTKIVDPQRSKKDPSLRSTLPWVTPFKTPLKIKIRNKKLFKTVFLVKILIETCLSTNKSSNLNKKIGIQLSHQKWSNQTEFLLEPVKIINKRTDAIPARLRRTFFVCVLRVFCVSDSQINKRTGTPSIREILKIDSRTPSRFEQKLIHAPKFADLG